MFDVITIFHREFYIKGHLIIVNFFFWKSMQAETSVLYGKKSCIDKSTTKKKSLVFLICFVCKWETASLKFSVACRFCKLYNTIAMSLRK